MNISNIPFVIMFIIILHHFIKHRNDKHLNLFQKVFQIKDINNHESFVLLFFGMGVGMRI